MCVYLCVYMLNENAFMNLRGVSPAKWSCSMWKMRMVPSAINTKRRGEGGWST